MAAFGLDLDSPLLPNVDAYINPTKDEDVHRNALNAVVSTLGYPYSWSGDALNPTPTLGLQRRGHGKIKSVVLKSLEFQTEKFKLEFCHSIN